MNKTGDKSGFGVGPTINPCTKGLWIWNKPITLEDKLTKKEYKVLIIDSINSEILSLKFVSIKWSWNGRRILGSIKI